MHITCLTIGSRGDVQPFLALGRALRQRGHRIRLATHNRFSPLADKLDLDFFPIGTDPQAMLRSAAGRDWLDSGQNPLALVRHMIRLGRPLTEQLTRETEAALAGTDAVIFSLFGNLAYHVAQARGLPSVMVHLQPVLGRTTAFPVPGSPQWPANLPLIGRLYNWMTFLFAEQIFWQPYRPVVQRWRRSLGLEKLSFWGPYRRLRQEKFPHLFAYSPRVVPQPADWPAHYHTTGYWPLSSAGWTPPEPLKRFIHQGRRPIYIGFGSMTDAEPHRLQQIIMSVLTDLNVRAIMLRGWAGFQAEDYPESSGRIFWLDRAPHEWLFPRMEALVHHGGAGTTAAGLRAGRPNVVVPYFADQFFWGDRVARLRVGPKPIPRQALTAAKLGRAIEQAITERKMRERAETLGHALKQEDGLGRAVTLIEKIFKIP